MNHHFMSTSANNSNDTIAQQLGAYAAGLTLEKIPHATVTRAKLLLLDAIGVALAAASFEFGRRAVRGLSALDSGDAQVIGLPHRLAVRDAVLVNGILAHGLDFDDTSISARVHAGAACMPAALTLAAALGKSGLQMLLAYIAGMECTMRIGAVAKGGFKEQGFYPVGVAGAFGTAIIAGRLLDLDAAELARAQGIAYSTASGNQEFVEEMAWTKRMHPGWAGVGGITAALLARGGYVGPTLPYEGRNGLYRVYLGAHEPRSDISLATRGFNEIWEIDKVAVKPLPACYFSIAAIDAACTLHHQHSLRTADIAQVRVLLPQAAVETVCIPAAIRRKPTDTYAAVFSVYYGVAVALARGRYGLADLEPAVLADPHVLALIERTEYKIDPHSTFPRYYSGAVRVTTHDGRTFEQREDVHRGAPERPLGESAIITKFMDNAARRLSGDKPARIRDAVLGLETVANVRTVSDLLAPA
jgi:2-methylcitrate dehydratase PrpD